MGFATHLGPGLAGVEGRKACQGGSLSYCLRHLGSKLALGGGVASHVSPIV